MMPSVRGDEWRDEDEALLARLTDEVVLERLFRAQAGPEAVIPRRAAGLIAAIRKTNAGTDVVDLAYRGNLEPLAERLEPGSRPDETPEILHHLALFHARVADARGGSVDALVRSLTAWLALGRDEGYMRELGEAVTGSALPKAELSRALEEAPLWAIEELGRRAREGAREGTAEARSALAALARAEEACRLSRAPDSLVRAATRKAASLRAEAAADALAPIESSIAEATAQGEPMGDECRALFSRVAAVWRWSGEDEAVEQFAVEQAASLGWNHYRASRWTELDQLLEPIAPLVDSLSRRIAGDPTRIAYAGLCAQMLVFRAERRSVDERIKILEWALTICPTHRNSRLVLANALCERAARHLPGARAPSHADYEEALALIERAEKLFPAASRIEDLKQRLDAARKLLGRRA
jgi:hypothetical protein